MKNDKILSSLLNVNTKKKINELTKDIKQLLYHTQKLV